MNFMKILYSVSPYNFLNIFKFYLDLKLLAKSWFLQAQKKKRNALKHLPILQDRNKNWKKWDAAFKTLNKKEHC